MWKCKKCGGTEFIEEISGGNQISVFDKEGNVEAIYDQDIEYSDLYCSECNKSGKSIEEIAVWED
ncbi:hypothetical protein [Fusobacterium ulcerans]|uniref:hypothetical protein n=1 Tax=Fusobacterium ulcerans TaxID=861 RepID=UPI002672C1E3|nr:hypothetical protein [Fusobacterium ulcerans]